MSSIFSAQQQQQQQPVHPSLFSSSKEMHRRRKPLPCSVPQHVNDLEVDVEATHEGKTELGRQCEETKADSEVSSPVLPTCLNSIRYLPLSRITLKERSKYFLTFMLRA